MLEIYERLGTTNAIHPDVHLVLDHQQREKGRLRIVSAEGDEIRIFLERGKPLQVGEYLRSRCGKTVLVEAAAEAVATASCDDWETFSRACYHLGNRHVKIQIGERWLRIAQDHVLEEMLQLLGLQVRRERAEFIPESGAYAHGHHHH
jgi:urease accessory protein